MHERRRRRRFPLNCTVEFERDGQTFTSGTLNISSQGFYCVVDQPVRAGEELRCLVDLMEGHAGLSLPGVSLNCDVVVLRSEEREDGRGIACWIQNYTVVRPASNRHRRRTRRRSFLQ
jgi:hypothetical protein